MRGGTLHLTTEVLVVAAFVLLYFGVRGATVGAPARAAQNARHVLTVERWLHVGVEHAVQDPLHDSSVLTNVVNWVYIWGHWPVIVATLLWLVLRHPATYLVTRDALLVSGAVGMIVFALFPVMPPRLLDPGLVDTVTERSVAYRVLQPPAFVNPYAAMPSLHVGWDLLIGIALVTAASRWWVRAVGVLLPALMAWAVVATANHYLLDAVAGTVLVLAAHALVIRLRRPDHAPGTRTLTPRAPTGVVRAGALGPWRPAGPGRCLEPGRTPAEVAMHIKTWHVEVYIDEIDDRTTARAVLHSAAPTHKEGHGETVRSPGDADVPEIGDEVAVARALHHLADVLLQTAEEDIEAIEDKPVSLRFTGPLQVSTRSTVTGGGS